MSAARTTTPTSSTYDVASPPAVAAPGGDRHLFLPRAILALTGLLAAGIGVWFLIDPDRALQMVPILAPDAEARTAVRAFYGGLDLGLGILLLLGALVRRFTSGALVALVLLMAGCAAGRAYGIVVDSAGTLRMVLYFAVEAGLAVLGAAGLVGLRRGDARHARPS